MTTLRCWWRFWSIHYTFTLVTGINIQKMSPTLQFSHQHPKIFTNFRSPAMQWSSMPMSSSILNFDISVCVAQHTERWGQDLAYPTRIIRDNTASNISKILPAYWLKSRIRACDWVLLNWSECQKIRFERGCTLNHSFFDHVILSSGISFKFSFKSLSECSRMIEHKL